ncbi:DUF2283 domain-containing protein [Quadrisphaera sp. DSM 44207]|uniref:DUF2283 domain-containing protein n=1 Tax=Quadrisphaera sp. DSM 44207 TaxID=1881057 RepID=UPI00210134F5|nr:DUF2283 domain-containing protein [Quadrisphaera sp. DSM 44207]
MTYDPDADAAYVFLVDRIADGEAAAQLPSISLPGGHSEVILDFNADGRLLGVEVLGAGRALPQEVLDRAEPP